MKIKELQNRLNEETEDDFLGVSPNEMHILLYGSLDEMKEFVLFNESFRVSLLEDVPVIKKFTLFIKLIGEEGEAKATKNGNLPKKIVNALYDFSPLGQKFIVPTEEYAPNILALRHAVTDCGWLKRKSGKFSLTKKGRQLFEKGVTASAYVMLLRYWLRNFNWAFTDGYPSCGIVQQAAIFSLYIVSKKASEYIAVRDFAKLFVRAFPAALSMLPEETYLGETSEERLERILGLRFLDRFAAYFGLLDYTVDESLPYLEREKTAKIKSTALFGKVLNWCSEEERKIF